MTATIIEVQANELSDGRDFLPEHEVVECPALLAFVDRFSNYWTYDFRRQGWVSPINRNGES